jgi:hypothetical protein
MCPQQACGSSLAHVPESGLVPSVAAGNTVSPPSATSDLRARDNHEEVSQSGQHACNGQAGATHRYISRVATRCPPFCVFSVSWK